MKLLTLTLLLAVPTPLTFFAFVFVATALYTYALLNHLTNSRMRSTSLADQLSYALDQSR